MARQGGSLLPTGHIPQLDRLVRTPRGQAAPIRTKGHAQDPSLMARQGGSLLPTGHVPQLDRLVPTPRGQAAPIRTKGHARDPSLVMPGNWALPDWLESRGGTSQESLYFLVFRVVRLQQNRECLCKPFVLRLPAIVIEANRPRRPH